MSGVWGASAVLAATVALGCRDRAEAVQRQSALRALVRQRMPAIEQATGLKFKHDPAVAVRSRNEVRDYIIHKFDEDLPPAEMDGLQAALRLFGFIPESLVLRESFADVLTEQIGGYFDPDSNTLYVPTDIDSFIVRTSVTHELVHALQGQYMNLDSILNVRHENDRRGAAEAVLEGQATLVQTLVMMPEQRIEQLPSFWEARVATMAQQRRMPAFAHAPRWLRETLIFPYLAGADFVRWYGIKHQGQPPYGAAMPVSTEQILHPDRYDAGKAPLTLRFAAPSADTVRYEDDLGEFEVRLLFAELLDDSTEEQATWLASGWGGDRYRVLGPAFEALVWYSAWDNSAAASRFAKGLARAWVRRRPGATRRFEITQLSIEAHPVVRLVDAPARWVGWSRVPTVRIVRR
jgi:hypothetical protein